MLEIELPDGTILEAPDGADPSVVAKNYLSRKPKPVTADPTEGMSGTDKFLAGTGKAFVDTWRGLKQIAPDMTASEGATMDAQGNIVQSDATTQRVTTNQQALQSEIDEAKRLDAPLMKTGAGIAGNIVGNIAIAAPTMAVPGVNTVAGASAVGAGMGFIQPVATDESRTTNTGTGAVGGGVGSLVPKAIGRAIRPNVAPEVRSLMQEGVTPTPGQVLGGTAKRIEEAATSIPIVGDAIKAGQRRAIHDFNRAAINRALKPIGQAIEKGSPVGRVAVDNAHRAISGAYDDLLPKMTGVMDDDLVTALSTSLKEASSNLPESQAKQLDHIVMNDVFGKFQNGKIDGEGLKQIQSKVGKLIRRYGRSENPDHLQMSEALKEVGDALRSMIKRANPEKAPSLDAVDSAYAMLLRVERAAGSLGAKDGVFTPAQLTSATKALDPSLRKSGFARGNALMQDFAESGKEVLSQTVPDSGTPYRLLTNVGAAGGIGYLSPEVLAGTLAVSGAYSSPGQKVLSAALAQRPGMIENMSPKMLRIADFARQGASLAVPSYRLSQD